MTVTFPKIRVGSPVRHESLSVFPLYADRVAEIEYRLAAPAIADETLLVEEVDQQGSVPDLLVENKGDVRVLFLEGEELIGAKQNRVLNASVLIAAHSKTKIPVSCVEQGRWQSRTRYFGSSGSHVPNKLRRALKSSVSRSVKEERGHGSDQGEIWREVESLHASHGVESGTAAMYDAYAMHHDKIESYQNQIPYIEDALGMAVAIGPNVVSVDLFDKPSTCENVWERMLSGVVFDAIESGDQEALATVDDVEKMITTAKEMKWTSAESVGEGDEYRAESEGGDHGSTLSLEETIVHGNVLCHA